MAKGDHVVMSNGAFKCCHCGDTYTMPLPCNVAVLVAASKAYLQVHRSCRKPREPLPDDWALAESSAPAVRNTIPSPSDKA